MKTLTWTLLAVLTIGWSFDVQCRSIDTTPSPSLNIQAEQKATSDAIDVAAEILTVEAIGEAVDKTLESEVQAKANAEEKAIGQVLKRAETVAIKEILEESSTTGTVGQTPDTVNIATKILTVEVVGEALDKELESKVQAEATAKEQAIRQIMKLAETEAIKGILDDVSKTSNVSPLPSTQPNNLNIPIPTLDFESGSGDNDNEISGTRDKRTISQISGYATCLFTILVNPNCFTEMRNRGGGGGGGIGTARAGGLFGGLFGGAGGRSSSSSRSSSRQEAYNRQLKQWMEYQKRQIAKLNATEGGNYTTPFPILPPSPPPPEDEETTQRPQGFIGRFIQWKLNAIPNLFRTVRSLFSSLLPFLQNLGGNRGGGGGGGGGLFAGLGGGGGSGGGGFGNSNSNSDSGSSYRPSSSSSSSSSLSSGNSISSSGSSSGGGSGGGGSAAETSTYRISLG